MNPNPFAKFAAGNTDTSFDSPKKRKYSDETSDVIDLCELENEELKIPQLLNHRTFIPNPSPKSNPSDLFIYDQVGTDSKVPPEKEVIDLTADVQGHPKDDSAYLTSDDSDAPRRTMRIRKTTSRYGLESQEGSDEDANSMEQDEESESEHGSDEDAYSMDQEDESDSEPKGEPEGCFAEEVEEEEFEMDKEEEEWKLKHDPLAKKDGDFDSVSINQEDKDDVNQWQMVVFGQDFDSKPQRNVHGKNRPKPPSSHSIT